tara:strand:- start:125 stop:307 length:183 start_codon:yes stop_codon:yes gene_type:complete
MTKLKELKAALETAADKAWDDYQSILCSATDRDSSWAAADAAHAAYWTELKKTQQEKTND